jgi:hypothetical protein
MSDAFDMPAFLKQFRSERGITLKAAYPEAPSTLSRMENNKNTISADRLHEIMTREGLRYWDLQVHSDQFISPFKQLFDELVLERFNFESPRIGEAINRYRIRVADRSSKILSITAAVLNQITLMIKTRNVIKLDEKMQSQIEALLLSNDDWIFYDYGLLRLSAQLLDTERLVLCLTKAISQNSKQSGRYLNYFAMVLEQCCLILVMRHYSGVHALCEDHLSKLRVDYFDGLDAIVLNFILMQARICDAELRANQVSDLVSAAKLLELNDMANFLERIDKAIQTGKEIVLL